MVTIVVLVAAGTVFALGMLLGQQLNRRSLHAYDRQIAALRRERDELVRNQGLRRRG